MQFCYLLIRIAFVNPLWFFCITELHAGLSKLSVFLQNTLPKECLSSEAEFCRKECLTIVERMNDFLKNPKNNNHKDNMLLNAGLSISSQSLNEANEFNGVSTEKIPRSGSLPDISSYQSENYEEWQVTTTLKVCFIIFSLGYSLMSQTYM